MPIVFLIRFSANKEKAYRLTLMYQLYAFTLYFTFPLLKVLNGEIVYQLLLVGVFIALFFLARFDQRTEVPIVYPDNNKDKVDCICLLCNWNFAHLSRFWRRLHNNTKFLQYIWRCHHDAVRFNHSVSACVLAYFPVKFLGV